MPKTDNLLWLMSRAIELPLADGTAVLFKVALRAVEEMLPPGVTLPIGKKYFDDGMAQLERRV
ncbi:MAG: hypothetical protein MR693_00915 [Bacteroidales bacterium]|nr:hypothetical protein [Bacteroidales bacterium]